METAFAPAARFVAFADSAPVLLTDFEDLHEADQDAALGDRLAEGYGPAAAARLVGHPGRAALLAHELGTRAALLLL
ncbi:MAG: hypothetical protein JWR45_701 [Blastococcus sp.]|jgi:hypothetical protein|nr:hypothetical protein [Blastococcus sp.]